MSSKLAIYLNDHLLGSTAGLELARRAAASNRDTEYGAFLSTLADELAEDRDALLAIMRDHDIGTDRLKVIAGWAGEKLGRLKLNGQLTGYSPLSRLVELEALSLGTHGRRALWQSLQQLNAADPRELSDLLARAERHLAQLEDHRRAAVGDALAH